jgi:hypothetical protein
MPAERRPQATIAAAIVPPANPVRRPAPRASQQATMAVPAVPQQAKRSRQADLATQAVAVVPQADVAHARTMIATERTMIATTPKKQNKTVVATALPAAESSCDIPIIAELDDDVPVERPRARRQITVGDGVLQRVPQRKMWMLQAAIVLVGMSIGLAAFAGS